MTKRTFDSVISVIGAGLLIATLGFLIAPLLVSVVMSFDSRAFLGTFPPPSFSLQWYARFFSDDYYMSGLANSLMVAGVATLISVLTGVSAALGLSRGRFPGRDFLAALFLSPLMIPGIVIGFSFLILFSNLGLVNGRTKLMIAHVAITFPYVVRATLASITGIGRSLEEAAASLGAGEWRTLWTIVVPLAKTGIVVGALFAFTTSMDDVSTGIFLADSDSYTLPLVLVAMMRANFDLTIAAASSVLIFVAFLLLLIADRVVGLDRIIGQGVFRSTRSPKQ